MCISAAAATAVEAKPKTDLVLIPGGKGKAVRMKKGDTIKIINTHGTQVDSHVWTVICSTASCLLLLNLSWTIL